MGTEERKEREKEKRRSDIIEAGEKIFFEKGFEKTTMDEIAEKVQLSKGTLYLYFKSKEDLLFAICRKGLDMLSTMMQEVRSEQVSGYENLRSIGLATVEFARKFTGHFNTLMYFQRLDLNILNIGQEQLENYIRQETPVFHVRQCIEQGMRDDSLRSDLDAELLAASLWSQMLGVLMVSRQSNRIYGVFGVRSGDVIDMHFELITNGIKKRS